jgi:hypothetical protein
MLRKNVAALTLFLLIITNCFPAASAKTTDKSNQRPFSQNEKFVVRALVTIQSAQYTFQATSGKGNFGSLNDLRQADFIDEVLASGEKYGYYFAVNKVDHAGTTAATFYATATPRLYQKSGRKSFYINQSSEVRGADKGGEPANSNDPVIDTCFSGNENCTIGDLRTLHSAQSTYQSAIGNGNFGTLNQLYNAKLINQNLASGLYHGYVFTCTIVPETATTNSFKITAVPMNYGVSGIKSYFIDKSGIIRGADKNGAPANENDPPI